MPTDTPAAPVPSPTNRVTDAVTKLGKEYLSIRSNGMTVDTQVSLSNGKPLGIVQSVSWEIDLSGVSKAVVTIAAAPGELGALVENTVIQLIPATGYPPFRYLWAYYRTKLDRVRAAPGYHPIRYLYDWYTTKLHLLLNPPTKA